MPHEFAIVVDPESMQRSGTGQVAGVLYTRIGGREFPEMEWSDSVVIVLGWWVEAILMLLNSESIVHLRFMDGPFQMTLTTGPNGMWILEPSHNEVRTQAVAIPARAVTRALMSAVRVTLDACEQRGWESADSDHLLRSSRRLAAIKV